MAVRAVRAAVGLAVGRAVEARDRVTADLGGGEIPEERVRRCPADTVHAQFRETFECGVRRELNTGECGGMSRYGHARSVRALDYVMTKSAPQFGVIAPGEFEVIPPAVQGSRDSCVGRIGS